MAMTRHQARRLLQQSWQGVRKVSEKCSHLAELEEHYLEQAGQALKALDRSLFRPTEPVCRFCGDSHRVSFANVQGMCTQCPLPCARCKDARVPYCATTPCPCDCHANQGS